MEKDLLEEDLCVDPSFTCENRKDVNGSRWVKNGQEMIDERFPIQLDIELNMIVISDVLTVHKAHQRLLFIGCL